MVSTRVRFLLVTVVMLASPGIPTQKCAAQDLGELPGKWFPCDEADLHTQITSVTQDDEGLLYVSHVNGIHVFDGTRWYPVEGARLGIALITSSDGDVFAALRADFGLVVEERPGHFVFESFVEEAGLEGALNSLPQVMEGPEGFVYFRYAKHLVRFDPNIERGAERFRVWEAGERGFRFIGELFEEVVIQVGSELMVIAEDEFEGIETPPWPDGSVLMEIVEREGDRSYFFTRGDGLFTLAEEADVPDQELRDLVSRNRVRGVHTLENGWLAIGFDRGLALVDDEDQLQRWVDFVADSPRLGLYGRPFEDRERSLWLPGAGGLARVDLGGGVEEFHGPRPQTEAILALRRHRGHLFAGTPRGLFRVEVSGVGKTTFVDQELRGHVFSLLEFGDTLVVGTANGVYEWRGEKQTRLIHRDAGHCLAVAPNGDSLLIGGRDVVGLAKEAGSWKKEWSVETTFEQVMTMAVVASGTIWLQGAGVDGFTLARLRPDDATLELIGEVPLDVGCLVEWKDKLVFSSSLGLLFYNPESDRFEPDEDVDKALFPMGKWAVTVTVDSGGALWGWIDEKCVFRLRDVGGELKVDDPLYYVDAGDVSCIYPDGEGGVWLSTIRGQLFRHGEMGTHPADLLSPYVVMMKEGLETLRVASAEEYEALAYANSPRFEFSRPGHGGKVSYRSRLVGLSDRWSAWRSDPFREFTALHEGDYRFEVVARDSMGRVSKTAALDFRVLPPWYRTGWAWGLWGVSGLLGLLGITSIRSVLARRRVAALEREIDERKRAEEALSREVEEHRRTDRERERLENELREAQKMEAIGRLSGNIAHDFNNILTAILGEVDLALSSKEREAYTADLRQNLDQIRFAGERASGLIRQLLAYSRRQVLKPIPVDPAKALGRLKSMLSRVLRDDITLDLDCEQAPCCVRIDPTQLDQILINLVVNASESMPDGGRILIRVLQDQGPREHFSSVEPGQYVLIEVHDTGIGMDSATREQVFEPFFTTKSETGGTGLGLASVYGIVRQSGGRIGVESEPGRGSVFRVLLPQVDAVVPESSSDPSKPEVQILGKTVLLCDDDPAVRRVARMILKDEGACVLDADGPLGALELAQDHEGKLDLLVSDVVMPVMNGPELHKRLLSRLGRLPVVFISGYPSSEIDADLIRRQDVDFLEKPFTRLDFVTVVGGALERAESLREHRND